MDAEGRVNKWLEVLHLKGLVFRKVCFSGHFLKNGAKKKSTFKNILRN